MKQSIGMTYTLNFVIIFIVITFAFLFGIMSYYRAFKVNSRVSSIIEKYEGYNELAKNEISSVLSTVGYNISGIDCPNTKKGYSFNSDLNTIDNICVYEHETKNGYYRYGIITYITLDIPIIGNTIKLPVYTETAKIFEFANATN